VWLSAKRGARRLHITFAGTLSQSLGSGVGGTWACHTEVLDQTCVEHLRVALGRFGGRRLGPPHGNRRYQYSQDQGDLTRRARPENLATWESDRVEQAAAFVADTATAGWQEAVADRALECITPRTWNRLFSGHRQQECKVLADMAKDILDGKKALHDLTGSVVSRVTGWFGGSAVEQAVVRELAKRIPIPGVDQKATAVARCLQVIGIVLCLSVGSPLNRCQSFIDLALTETKEGVKQILIGAMDDWTSPSPAMIATWDARA
jgi:hypothetical protein